MGMAYISGSEKKVTVTVNPEKGNTFCVVQTGARGNVPCFGVEKWSWLFRQDQTGDIALTSLIEYLYANSPDFVRIEEGIEKFIEEYQAWKAKQAA